MDTKTHAWRDRFGFQYTAKDHSDVPFADYVVRYALEEEILRLVEEVETLRGANRHLADNLAAATEELAIARAEVKMGQQELGEAVAARDASQMTAEEGLEIIGELSAALAVLHGEELVRCSRNAPPGGDTTGCPGHLGEKAAAAVKGALDAWRDLESDRDRWRQAHGAAVEVLRRHGALSEGEIAVDHLAAILDIALSRKVVTMADVPLYARQIVPEMILQQIVEGENATLKANADAYEIRIADLIKEKWERERAEEAGIAKAQEMVRRLLATREDEIRLLRRERKLLIDLEKTRSNILGSLFSSGMAQTEDVNFVHETNAAMLALHLEASGGIVRPEGSPCRCVLCEPRRDLSPRAELADAQRGFLESFKGALTDAAVNYLKDVPPGAPMLDGPEEIEPPEVFDEAHRHTCEDEPEAALPPEEPPAAKIIDLMQALKASLAASKPRKPEGEG